MSTGDSTRGNFDARTARWHGARIKSLRLRQCLTLRAFCDEVALASNFKVSVTPSAVLRWEQGKHHVALRYRRHVAEVLGVDHIDLFMAPPSLDDRSAA